MRKTHEPQAALKALIAAVGVSTMVMASAPAHAGPLGFIKKAAEKELKKAAEARLQAEAERSGVGKLIQAGTTVATASEVQAPTEPQAGDEHEIAFDIAAGALKLVQNGTTVETADEVQADEQSAQQAGRGRARARAEIGSSALAADAEPQDAFMYFESGAGTGNAKGKGNVEVTWKVEKGTKYAGEATDESHKDWIIIQSLNPEEFRGGVFVATGDVNGDGRDDIIVGPALCKLVQNGTTVATAEDVLSHLSDEEEALWSRAKRTHNMTATCEKLVQNGTTVATASEIQAQHGAEPIGMLLPAVRAIRVSASSAPTGMSQNGTTVPSADTVQAPADPQAHPEFSVKSENSTNIGSSTGGGGGAGKVKFDRLSIKKYSDR